MPAPSPHDHQWWVVDTSFIDYALIVQCPRTHLTGMVENPTPQQWLEAFNARTNPYPLEMFCSQRVQIVEQDPVTKKWRKQEEPPPTDPPLM